MKYEVVAAVILVVGVVLISVWMLFHWQDLRETTLLQGAIPSVEKSRR